MQLVLSFPDQSASFVHGYEAGRLIDRMERGETPVNNNGFPVHAANRMLLEKACKQHGYIPYFGIVYFEWVEFLAIKKETSDN